MTEKSLLKVAVFSEIYRQIDVYNVNGAVDVTHLIRNIPRFKATSIGQRRFVHIKSPLISPYHELGKSTPGEELPPQVNSKVEDFKVKTYESRQPGEDVDRENRSEAGVFSPKSSFDFPPSESSDDSEAECGELSVDKTCSPSNMKRGAEFNNLLSKDHQRNDRSTSSGGKQENDFQKRKSQQKLQFGILRSNTTDHLDLSDTKCRQGKATAGDLGRHSRAAITKEFDLQLDHPDQIGGGKVGRTGHNEVLEGRFETKPKQIVTYSGHLGSLPKELNDSKQSFAHGTHDQPDVNTCQPPTSKPAFHGGRPSEMAEAMHISSSGIRTTSPYSCDSSATTCVTSLLLYSEDRSHSSSFRVSVVRGKTNRRARSMPNKTKKNLQGRFAGRVLTTLIQPFVQMDTQIREFCREHLRSLETQKTSKKNFKMEDSQSLRKLKADDFDADDLQSTTFSCGAPLIQKVSSFFGMTSKRHRRNGMRASIVEGMDWNNNLKNYSYNPSSKSLSPRVPNQRRKALSRGTPSKRNLRSSKALPRRSSRSSSPRMSPRSSSPGSSSRLSPRSSSPRMSPRSGLPQRQRDWHCTKTRTAPEPSMVTSETGMSGRPISRTQLRDLLRDTGTKTTPPMVAPPEWRPSRVQPMLKSDDSKGVNTKYDSIDDAIPRWWLYSRRAERLRCGLAPSRFQREHFQRLASMKNSDLKVPTMVS